MRRLRFFRFSQKQGQHFDDFWSQLRLLANEASLDTLTTEDLLVFRIIGGCTDDLLKEKFLRLSAPSLSDITKEAAKWEGVRRSMATYNVSPQPALSQQQQQQPPKPRCPNCSSAVHTNRKACPAKDKTCNICQKTGHFGRTRQGKLICRSAPQGTPTLPRDQKGGRPQARAADAQPASPPEDKVVISTAQQAST